MAQSPIVRQSEHAILFENGEIRLRNVRLSFPHLYEPYAKGTDDNGKPQTPAFSATFMLPKATHMDAVELCQWRIRQLLDEMKVRALPSDKLFLRDGDLAGRDEYLGHWIVASREKREPVLMTPGRQILRKGQWARVNGKDVKAEEVMYAGCYCNAIVNPWAQNNSYGKRINCNLRAVQFVKDGESFGAGRISEDDMADRFEDLGGDEEFADTDTGGL